MQTSRSLLLALLVLPAAALSAENEARRFLQLRGAGPPPQADQLAELNKENPEAYALVKALLTKRSLGLLDPAHPTASFANAGQQHQAVAGPEAFAISPEEQAHAAMSLSHQSSQVSQIAVPYADVEPTAHHDVGFNWKPGNSGMDDETMVQNVLGAVAQLKGQKAGLLTKSRSSSNEDNALTSDEATFGWAPAAQPRRVASPPPVPKENSYLSGLTAGIRTPEVEHPVVDTETMTRQHENSYLKEFDLGDDKPKARAAARSRKTSQVQDSSSNALSAFSWDDAPTPAQPKPEVAAPPKNELKFLSWLGVVKAEPVQKAPAAPAAPTNPYLMDLS